MKISWVLFTTIPLLLGLYNLADSQPVISGQDTISRTIITAFPFLGIAPDARSSGLGNTGVASIRNLAPLHWNVAGLSFLPEKFGLSYSGGPWLSKIINDISLLYFTSYYKISPGHVIAGSFRYFNLGDIFFTGSHVNPQMAVFKPREFAVDIGYAIGLSEALAIGISVRYIQTNIAGNFSSSTIEYTTSRGLGFDFGFLYSQKFQILNKNTEIGFGIDVSNLGPRVNYSTEDFKDPLPTNLRIGSSASFMAGSKAEFNFNLDFDKLLVPTPPVYEIDPLTGELLVDANGNPVIADGKDPNRGLFAGIAGSFADAPDGVKEELQEITTGFGLELLLKDKYALRTGFFNENELKGNRKFMTIGAGYKFKPLSLDVSYLIPYQQNHLLSETFRFSISFVTS